MSLSSPSPSARRFVEGAMAFMAGLAFGVLGEMTLAHKPPPAPAVTEAPSPPVDAGSARLDDLQHRLDVAAQKLDEHGQRIHDLEILNRAQCK